MRILTAAPVLIALGLLAGCSSSSGDSGTPGDQDAMAGDGPGGSDTGTGSGRDATGMSTDGAPDAGQTGRDADMSGMDATGPGDTGLVVRPELVPGSHVGFTAARVDIGDAFMDVTARLGQGMRSMAMGSRSFEWTIDGAHVTVWFANTNASADMPPNDVHPTDKVLWIAVDGSAFPGKTDNGIGIGSMKTMVEQAAPNGYGPAPHSAPLMNGGSIGLYYKTGFLVAYDNTNTVTTFTVCKAYPAAPDGAIDPSHARFQFTAGDLNATVISFQGGQAGSTNDQVKMLLGPPDGEGEVTIGTQMLHLISYAFIGIEVFSPASGQIGAGTTIFASVHAPYYGSLSGGGMIGVGSTRPDFEAALNVGTGQPSQGTPGLVCYELGMSKIAGVTYSADATPVVTTISLVFPQCP
jgi:hypothetical protein